MTGAMFWQVESVSLRIQLTPGSLDCRCFLPVRILLRQPARGKRVQCQPPNANPNVAECHR